MLLELLGPPGIGKTTSERFIRQELARRGYAVLDFDDLARDALATSAFGRFPGVRASAPVANRLLGLRVFIDRLGWLARRGIPPRLALGRPAVVVRMLLLARRIEAAFLDRQAADKRLAFVNTSGVFQMTASLRVWVPDSGQDRAADYLPRVSGDDMTVLRLTAGRDVVTERLQARGVPAGWPPGTRDGDGLHRTLAAFEAAVQASADEAGRLAIPVVPCDVAGSLAALPSSIAAALDAAGAVRS